MTVNSYSFVMLLSCLISDTRVLEPRDKSSQVTYTADADKGLAAIWSGLYHCKVSVGPRDMANLWDWERRGRGRVGGMREGGNEGCNEGGGEGEGEEGREDKWKGEERKGRGEGASRVSCMLAWEWEEQERTSLTMKCVQLCTSIFWYVVPGCKLTCK